MGNIYGDNLLVDGECQGTERSLSKKSWPPMSWRRGWPPMRVLPHNFANAAFANITQNWTNSNIHFSALVLSFVAISSPWQLKINNDNAVLWAIQTLLWNFDSQCYFRQSWLASSWALTALPPTSSPSCSSSSTPATGPSTWSSCPTSSSTGYLSESKAAQIVSMCLLVNYLN